MKTSKAITTLVYHRVDTLDTDPWGICVAPNIFEEQISYLKAHYPILDLQEALKQLAADEINEHTICLTFDDGYADNYLNAKPVLERHDCPATFFIATAFIHATAPFWWDELEYIFLHVRELPQQLSLTINGRATNWRVGNTITDAQWEQHQAWRWYHTPPTDRCSVFLALWEELRPLSLSSINAYLQLIRDWAGIKSPPGFRLPMNAGQLRSHFNTPLFTAGLHTHSHPDLSATVETVQVEEIERGRKLLQAAYNLQTNCLAYPYGRYNQATLLAVKALGLSACFTTEASAINRHSDGAKLGRYQVCNWSVEELKANLGL